MDRGLAIARREGRLQEAPGQALLRQLVRPGAVPDQVVGEDERPPAIALDDVVRVDGTRARVHQAFLGPFPDDLPPMARWIV